MRLGSRATLLRTQYEDSSPTLAAEVYGFVGATAGVASERHRHRYEVNPALVDSIEAAGLHFTGKDETNQRMEVAEFSRAVHPFYFGTQAHPELKSRPNRPSPLHVTSVVPDISIYRYIDNSISRYIFCLARLAAGFKLAV